MKNKNISKIDKPEAGLITQPSIDIPHKSLFFKAVLKIHQTYFLQFRG